MYYYAEGLRRCYQNQTLDVLYQPIQTALTCPKEGEGLTIINQDSGKGDTTRVDHMFFCLKQIESTIETTEDAYFRLHMLSFRCVKPHEVGLEGLFTALPNLAWTQRGPIIPSRLNDLQKKAYLSGEPLQVSHVDKFPYLVNYLIPSGVRIASGSQVRLGAYLGEGTTVMPAGYINFNAGTEGPAMVEGRVSAGVTVGAHSDIGGGASIMGTLSGGGAAIISVGKNCLIGANAGTGISLGDGCTISAGLYVYGGLKVTELDAKGQPIQTCKARDLSGRCNLLFRQESQTGQIICKPNHTQIALNAMLHTTG